MSGPTIFRRLLRECLESPRLLAATVASLLSLSTTQLYLTWLAKRWVEEGLIARSQEAILHLTTRAAAVSVVMVLALFASAYLLASLNQTLVDRLRLRAEDRLLRAKLLALRQFASGDLLSRVLGDAAAVSGFAESVLKRIVGEGFLVVGAVSMMFYLEWRLALAAFGAGPPIVWIVTQIGRRVRRRGLRAQEELGRLSTLFSEQLSGFTTIKGFQTEAYETERFARQVAAYRTGVLRSEWWSASLSASVWLATTLGLLAVIAYGGQLVLAGRITEGLVLSFALYAIQTIEPVRRISEVYGRLQRTLAAAERVYEIIDAPWVEKGGGRSLPAPVRGELSFDRVSFGYRPERRVIDELSVRIDAGELVAVVAASGGGKSTLGALLCRFYDPTSGRILLDGVDLHEACLEDVRRVVSVIEQETFLFTGSLYENVCYGSWQAPRAAVQSATLAAGLGSLVGELPGGIDGRITEGGRNLSGGQRQRVALARAIVRDPRIVVLDEATSALDSEIEAQIFADLRPWLAERTVLVMAHRLSTVGLCPRVLLLSDGRLIGDGPIHRLRTECPAFEQLFADQFGRFGGEEPRVVRAASSRS